jgi:ribosomal protein L44E
VQVRSRAYILNRWFGESKPKHEVALRPVVSHHSQIAVLGLRAFFLPKLAERELQELRAITCPICRRNLQTIAALRSLWRVVRRCASRSSTETYRSSESRRPSVVAINPKRLRPKERGKANSSKRAHLKLVCASCASSSIEPRYQPVTLQLNLDC